jgi:hypothetical protein
MVEFTLAVAILLLLILRALAVLHLRKRVAAPPAHPAARRNAALSRAALDQDWSWPR